MCYAKELWARSPFPELEIGEDTRFVFSPAVRRIADISAAACIVGILHGRNTAPKSVHSTHWSSRPGYEAEGILGEDMGFYRRLTQAAPAEAVGHLREHKGGWPCQRQPAW